MREREREAYLRGVGPVIDWMPLWLKPNCGLGYVCVCVCVCVAVLKSRLALWVGLRLWNLVMAVIWQFEPKFCGYVPC